MYAKQKTVPTVSQVRTDLNGGKKEFRLGLFPRFFIEVRALEAIKYIVAEPLRGPIAQLVEHRADNAGVTGAIPVRPTTNWGCSSAGRARALQA